MRSDLPDITSDEELAEALGCDKGTVQARALAGDLPGLKFGRGWVFPREALLEALNRQARDEAAKRSARATPTAVALASAAGRKRRRALPVLPALPSDG